MAPIVSTPGSSGRTAVDGPNATPSNPSATTWRARYAPVAMAGSGGTPRIARVGPVYTPPAARCRGYGSALTAALSQHLRDAGAWRVALATDLANPTSNRIYQA